MMMAFYLVIGPFKCVVCDILTIDELFVQHY